jgi:hypothetical protein
MPSPESPAKSTDTLVFDITMSLLFKIAVSLMISPVTFSEKVQNDKKTPAHDLVMA